MWQDGGSVIFALSLWGILLVGYVAGLFLVVGTLAALAFVYDRLLLRRRRERHDTAVGAAADAGYREGEAAALAGRVENVFDLPPIAFSAIAPRWRRAQVVERNCERAWTSGFLRGHAACVRARVDAQLDAEVDELVADGVARLEVEANGEHRR